MYTGTILLQFGCGQCFDSRLSFWLASFPNAKWFMHPRHRERTL